ncbi:transcriptional regulator MraZ [Roseomonas sp. KE2513]|uniref:division/cell wall cluster transcriptional repressor MraZ n=1 Tax=Roseomonas sp. KE2513 TaxID=2479202 RepID=UPI0018DF4D09|nr:division/cell wall cluster transcriptional repressor MraZ [Roseomonas sp. KE2513]MBI0534254.1 transcriptional regulator MraZ [Roseomonas sp. KE2513]
MTHFMGTFTGKLDRKGRVSVPASFRAALERMGSPDLVLRLSHTDPCIEAWPLTTFETMAGGLDRLEVFSEEHDDLALSLFADAYPMRPDGDGRVMLADEVVAHAGLKEAISFVGRGPSFQIWEPGAAAKRVAEARQRARERGLTVPAVPNPAGRA